MSDMQAYNEADVNVAAKAEDIVLAATRTRLQEEAAADGRALVTVRTCGQIVDIPGADVIKAMQVEGWWVVVKAGEFKEGDQCVFFEVDCYLPLDDERYSFLEKNASNWQGIRGARLKTIRLRGQLSQGLALPLSIFPEIEEEIAAFHAAIDRGQPTHDFEDVRGLNFTGTIGIMKWEKVLSAQVAGMAKGNFPSFLRKSDQERAQNMPRKIFGYDEQYRPFDTTDIPLDVIEALLAKGELEWVGDALGGSYRKVIAPEADPSTQYEGSLKMDGMSMTVYGHEGKAGVCSRNLDLKIEGNEDNTLVRMATDLGLLAALEKYSNTDGSSGVAIQGELMGPGIQGNREDFKAPRFFVYNIFDIARGSFMTPYERTQFLDELREDTGVALDHVPILFYGKTLRDLGITNMDELLKFAEGPSFKHPVREGIVFKALDGRHQFKVISNLFLLKEKE